MERKSFGIQATNSHVCGGLVGWLVGWFVHTLTRLSACRGVSAPGTTPGTWLETILNGAYSYKRKAVPLPHEARPIELFRSSLLLEVYSSVSPYKGYVSRESKPR